MEAKQFSALVALGRELRLDPRLAEATIAARLAAHDITMHSLTAWTHVDLTSEGSPGKDDWAAFSLGVLAALRVLQPAFLPKTETKSEAKAEAVVQAKADVKAKAKDDARAEAEDEEPSEDMCDAIEGEGEGEGADAAAKSVTQLEAAPASAASASTSPGCALQ